MSKATDLLLDDDEEAHEGELVPVDPRVDIENKRMEQLQSVEREIFHDVTSVLASSIAFADLDPEAQEPPPEWIAQYGEKEAARRFRVARYALMKSSEVPYGMKLSRDIYLGMAKVKALEKQGPKTLNLTVAQIMAPQVEYPTIDVEEES